MTVQANVFRALRTASMDAALVAERVGCGRETARKACQYLIQRGCVRKHKIAGRRTVIYSAVIGKSTPRDLRGKRPESRNHRGAVAWAKWLLMMQAKHGPTWRYKPRGQLETIWQ